LRKEPGTLAFKNQSVFRIMNPQNENGKLEKGHPFYGGEEKVTIADPAGKR